MSDTKILFWNTQGVARKHLELLNLVQRLKIDIILLNETHLLPNRQFKLPNFITHTINKPLVNGHPLIEGTVILMNRKYIHHSIRINK